MLRVPQGGADAMQEESTMQPCRQFIQDVQSGATPITELCRAYGISRKTGYKCHARYEAGGLPALTDRSRRPQHSPTATPSELVRALLEARHHHPTWGPRKLLRLLRQELPDAPWPARSTVALHLHRAGLVVTPQGERVARASRYWWRFAPHWRRRSVGRSRRTRQTLTPPWRGGRQFPRLSQHFVATRRSCRLSCHCLAYSCPPNASE